MTSGKYLFLYIALEKKICKTQNNFEKQFDIILKIYVDIFIMIMITKMYCLINKDIFTLNPSFEILYQTIDFISGSYIKASFKVDKTLRNKQQNLFV